MEDLISRNRSRNPDGIHFRYCVSEFSNSAITRSRNSGGPAVWALLPHSSTHACRGRDPIARSGGSFAERQARPWVMQVRSKCRRSRMRTTSIRSRARGGRRFVAAFARGDHGLNDGVPNVGPVSPDSAKQIREYIEDYGETLVELSDETWETSVAQWQEECWDVVLDLWTEGEGCSDMILTARVYEAGTGFRVEVGMAMCRKHPLPNPPRLRGRAFMLRGNSVATATLPRRKPRHLGAF